MSTPALVDLVCQVYEGSYGKVGAKFLRILLNQGRSSAAEIVRLTGLPPSTVQRTLVSLVTNRFILFWTGSSTFYSANWPQVFTILWTGELLSRAEGAEKKELSRLLVEGLLPANSCTTPSTYIREVAEWEFWPKEELVESLEAKARLEVAADPDAFGKSEAAKKQLVQTHTENELGRIRVHNKNAADSSFVAIDWNRFLIVARRYELAAFAKRFVGPVSSKLYEVVLRLSENSILSPHEARIPTPETAVTTQQIVDELDEEFIAQLGAVFDWKKDGTTNGDAEIKEESSSKRVKLNKDNFKGVNLGLSSLTPAELVNNHLTLLSSVTGARFVQRIGGRQQGEWFVAFDRTVEDLQERTLEEIIAQSFGETAARLIRLIRATGKLDEKMLANQALLPALEIRHQMSALASYGFADIQELAKPNEQGSGGGSGSAAAAQKRSLFLWYHRPKWAYSRLLDLLYAQLSEILRELHDLRSKNKTLLVKLTREDVMSNLEQFLTAKEREELDVFRQAEHALYKKMNMVDRTVRIFREY